MSELSETVLSVSEHDKAIADSERAIIRECFPVALNGNTTDTWVFYRARHSIDRLLAMNMASNPSVPAEDILNDLEREFDLALISFWLTRLSMNDNELRRTLSWPAPPLERYRRYLHESIKSRICSALRLGVTREAIHAIIDRTPPIDLVYWESLVNAVNSN